MKEHVSHFSPFSSLITFRYGLILFLNASAKLVCFFFEPGVQVQEDDAVLWVCTLFLLTNKTNNQMYYFRIFLTIVLFISALK